MMKTLKTAFAWLNSGFVAIFLLTLSEQTMAHSGSNHTWLHAIEHFSLYALIPFSLLSLTLLLAIYYLRQRRN